VPPLTAGAILAIADPFTKVFGEGSDEASKLGATSVTVIVSTTVSDPALFSPLIVYTTAAVIAVGLPDSTPVVALNVSPDGNAGDTVYVVTDPPDVVGMFSATSLPLTYTHGDVEYEFTLGGILLTATVTDTVVELPALDAVITYADDEDAA